MNTEHGAAVVSHEDGQRPAMGTVQAAAPLKHGGREETIVMAMRTIRVRGDRIPILLTRTEATLFAIGNSSDRRFLALREKVADILAVLPDYLAELDEASEPEERSDQLSVDHGALLEPRGNIPQAQQPPENRRCRRTVPRANGHKGWCNKPGVVREIGDRGLTRWVCGEHVTRLPEPGKRSRGRPRKSAKTA